MKSSSAVRRRKPAAKKPAPARRHHLDRRAAGMLTQPNAADDTLMSTKQLAEHLGVSVQFLEIGRSKNYGPKFVRIADRVIRYRMDDVRRWLAQRAFGCTAEYQRSAAGGAP